MSPRYSCSACGGTVAWLWEEAFDKAGFDCGRGLIMTDVVERILRDAGYEVGTERPTFCNLIITSIKRNEEELFPLHGIELGEDDPRAYLPETIIRLLDRELPPDSEVVQ
jgi:hypothetical protein